VYETQAEAAERRERHEKLTANLRRMEATERPRFDTATSMLSWWFAVSGHMESTPAIDPSAEVIQGLRVDRDERLWWIQSVRQALQHVERAQGHALGVLLLWLHLRPRIVTGYKVRKGIRIPVVLEPVPLWELHRAQEASGYRLSRRKATEAYWEALRKVEDYAWERGWILTRARRAKRAEQSWRRR